MGPGEHFIFSRIVMTEDAFWSIVERACQSDSRTSNDWHERLVAELSQLPADAIVRWDHLFDGFVARAATIDLMAPLRH